MRDLLYSNYGGLGLVLATGVIILILFIVLRFFKMLISMSFIGFLLSLFSYFVYDYIFVKVPLIACVAFLLCISGFSKSGFIGKLFALIGTILSGYIIIHTLGFI